jgi:D-alanyl-D-alanine carboxypeptidase
MATSPYRLVGGAMRPDALNFNEAFGQALNALYAAAPPQVQRELALTSGYRSPEQQQILWNASDKTGHTVARPGRSKHQHGTAADLAGFGIGGNGVSQTTKDWVHANAKAHGLYFPMSYEPWHIQLQGDGGAPGTTPAGGGTAGAMAAAIDPRAVVLAQMEGNPFKAITDVGPKRGGLVGAGSAGGGEAAAPDADPGIPPMETAQATMAPDPLSNAQAPIKKLSQLAQMFKVKPIGQASAGSAPEGQALPIRRA